MASVSSSSARRWTPVAASTAGCWVSPDGAGSARCVMSIPRPSNGSVPALMLGRCSARAAFGSNLDLEVGGAEQAERLPQGGLGFTEPFHQAGDEGVEGVDGEHGLDRKSTRLNSSN